MWLIYFRATWLWLEDVSYAYALKIHAFEFSNCHSRKHSTTRLSHLWMMTPLHKKSFMFWKQSQNLQVIPSYISKQKIHGLQILLVGNLLTVVALLKCQKLRSHATTMFVISLAVSDLLFCTINLPLTASRYVHEEWRLGTEMCR